MRHIVEGLHELPVVLSVDMGKMVRLRFTGRTVWPGTPVIGVDTSHVVMRPVSIGDMDPPVQSFEVHNPGDVPVRFACDVAAVEALAREQGYGFEVFSIENPSGEIEPGCSAQVRCLFHPVEPRLYTVELPIALEGAAFFGGGGGGAAAGQGQQQSLNAVVPGGGIVGGTPGLAVTLSGRGYEPSRAIDVRKAEKRALARLCWEPSLRIPGQIASLSQQFIVFGDVPQHAVCRQVLTVRNESDGPARFEWTFGTDLSDEVLRVSPASGTIPPRGSVLCRVVLLPGPRVEVFDLNMCCLVVDEADEARLDKERTKLLKKMSRASRPGTKASHHRQTVAGAGSTTAGGGAGAGADSLFGGNDEDDSDALSRFSTPSTAISAMPPNNHNNGGGPHHRAQSAMSDGRAVSRASTGLSRPGTAVLIEEKLEGLGEANHSTLHVNIQARSYAIDAYRSTFAAEQVASHYVPRYDLAGDEDGTADPYADPRSWAALVGDRGDLLCDVVSGLLREILDDPVVAAEISSPPENPPVIYAAGSSNPIFERYRKPRGLGDVGNGLINGDDSDPYRGDFYPSMMPGPGGGAGAGGGTMPPARPERGGPVDAFARSYGADDDDLDHPDFGGGGGSGDFAGESRAAAADHLVARSMSPGSGGGGGGGGGGNDDEQAQDDGTGSLLAGGAAAVPPLNLAVGAGDDHQLYRPGPPAVIDGAQVAAEHELRARLAKRREKDAKERQTVELLRHADVEEMFEYILEGTIFNVISEAAHGEYNLRGVPRNIVTDGIVDVPDAPTPGPEEELLGLTETQEDAGGGRGRTPSFSHSTAPRGIRPPSSKGAGRPPRP
jgi:hypothetical protein